MAEIRLLMELNSDQLSRVLSGYTSPARYRVTREETPEHISFHLDLEPVNPPFVKTWETVPEDFQFYETLVEDGFSLGAYEAGQLVGVALAEVRRWNRSLMIWEFHVLEGYRRQGVGRQLMDILEGRARAAGLRIMEVEAQNTNTPAIQFYRQMGFAIEAIDTSYYSNHDLEPGGEVALFMKRRLEP